MKLDKYFFIQHINKSKLKNLLQITANYYHKKNIPSEILVFHSQNHPRNFIIYFKSNPSFKQFKIFFYFFSKITHIIKTIKLNAYWTIKEEDIIGQMSQSFLIGKRFMFYFSPTVTHKNELIGVDKNNDIYKFGFTDNYELEEIRDKDIRFEEKEEYYINKFVHLFTVISSDQHVSYKVSSKKTFIILSLHYEL